MGRRYKVYNRVKIQSLVLKQANQWPAFMSKHTNGGSCKSLAHSKYSVDIWQMTDCAWLSFSFQSRGRLHNWLSSHRSTLVPRVLSLLNQVGARYIFIEEGWKKERGRISTTIDISYYCRISRAWLLLS